MNFILSIAKKFWNSTGSSTCRRQRPVGLSRTETFEDRVMLSAAVGAEVEFTCPSDERHTAGIILCPSSSVPGQLVCNDSSAGGAGLVLDTGSVQLAAGESETPHFGTITDGLSNTVVAQRGDRPHIMPQLERNDLRGRWLGPAPASAAGMVSDDATVVSGQVDSFSSNHGPGAQLLIVEDSGPRNAAPEGGHGTTLRLDVTNEPNIAPSENIDTAFSSWHGQIA